VCALSGSPGLVVWSLFFHYVLRKKKPSRL
jgi:hypothetical protein